MELTLEQQVGKNWTTAYERRFLGSQLLR